MSLRPRAGARVPPSSAPLGSLHGAAIGFKPGRALPVGGPVTLKPEDGEQRDARSQQELTPNLPTDVRELVDAMVWELKEGRDAAGNATYKNYQAGTVLMLYMKAATDGTPPKTTILREPMERDDYEELKAMYDRHNLLTPEERGLMQTLERAMHWTGPYTPSAAYTARREFLRQQNEESDASAEAAARAELQRRLATGRIAESRRLQEELERNAGGQEAFARHVREEVLLQDDTLTAEEAQREARELEEAERRSREQFAEDERLRRQQQPRAASARNLQAAFDQAADSDEEVPSTAPEDNDATADLQPSAFDQAADWSSSDSEDNDATADLQPSAFRQSEIGQWLYRTFGEIADIAKNVDPTDPQFDTRSEAVLLRGGRYGVYEVQLYVPPFPGEAAPRLGDEDSQEVHDMLWEWVHSLLTIVKLYQTADEVMDAKLSARALLGDISLSARTLQAVDFQYKAEVMEQFYKAVKSLIAEFDPNEETRRNAQMDMLGGAQLVDLAFIPPDREQHPAAPAPVDAAADGLYHNDNGDAVTAWARGVTDRLVRLYQQGYNRSSFERRINELIWEGRPGIDLNIWLRDSNRAPVASEQEELQAALNDWQKRAAELLQAWQLAANQYSPYQYNDFRFRLPRRLKRELIAILSRAPDSADVPNFIGQQRVYDVFAEYISRLDTVYDPEYQTDVSIPVIYGDEY